MPEYQCTVCHIGALHHKRVTYTQIADEQLVTLPNVSVWLCDVCGEYTYDPDTMRRLQMLLGMMPGLPETRRRPEARSDDAPAVRQTSRRGSA